jgi:SAM-dependent methyltransferase
MGHQVAAIDLSLDAMDGLGAHLWYRSELEKARCTPFTIIQSEFDHLPLTDGDADVALFNASLHYSVDAGVTLREALRVLSPRGILAIVDSPVYRKASSGEQMVREREIEFERTYGFRSDSVPAENFLTVDRLNSLARDLGLRWEKYVPPGAASRVKTRFRRIRGLREFAEMPVIAGFRA